MLYYSAGPTTLSSGSDTPGASIGSLGNSILKPEYSAETEFGFDLAMFSGRTSLEFTSYDKKTTDALINKEIAPSVSGLANQFVNIGSIQNTGVELTWNQKVYDSRQLGIDFTLTGSTNKNRMLTLGAGILPISSGNRGTQRNLPGYPLYGLWDKRYTFTDANNDGIIVLSEMTFSDTAVYQGATFPTRELAFTPSIELLNHKLRISSQIDSKWGFKKFNNTLRHQCQNGVTCRGRYDQSAPLEMQAAALATGCTRVNIGTAALEQPEWCAKVIAEHGDRVALGLAADVVECGVVAAANRLDQTTAAQDERLRVGCLAGSVDGLLERHVHRTIDHLRLVAQEHAHRGTRPRVVAVDGSSANGNQPAPVPPRRTSVVADPEPVALVELHVGAAEFGKVG